MAVPKYDQMYRPFLECLKDGKNHRMPELCKSIAKQMNLSAADTLECRGTNRSPLLQYRISWTKTYLTKAGLVETVQRGVYQITDEGRKVLEECPEPLDNAFLMRYPDFREFVRPSAKSQKQEKPQDPIDDDMQDDTPDSVVDRAVSQLNSALADDILSAILSKPAGFFEWLVIQLLEKMGYGTSELENDKCRHKSRDNGIDGIIRQDRLGFNKIYIQAKRWDNTPVGRPEVQKFYGALPMGMTRGLFITTSRFSEEAQEYAQQRNLVLIDGKKLAQLMIEFDLGVSAQKTYVLKTLDTDFFEDNLI
ncbi:MAG: restriction endonuclease [Agathobaculum sp.]|jgi:restriction system protein|uniref:restriction endonuclease n=1 Tax=Agathobaculum sp. TaxID=2048138 RepID=UPI003D928B3D